MAAILGIGVDVVEVARIASLRERQGEKGLGLIFLPSELEYCLARANTDEALAARFAAKEAVMKALGTGWTGGVVFNGIEVLREGLGRPEVVLHGSTLRCAESLGAGKIHVSVSHGAGVAMAQALIEKAEVSQSGE